MTFFSKVFFRFTLIFAVLWVPVSVFAEFEIYDDNGQYLGLAVDLDDLSKIQLYAPDLDSIIQISLSGNEGKPTPYVQVYFESEDCTGTPYLPSNDAVLFNMIYNLPCPSEKFVKIDFENSKVFTPLSVEFLEVDGCHCSESFRTEDTYYPVTEVQLGFTTPLALPLVFKPFSGPIEVESITTKQLTISNGTEK